MDAIAGLVAGGLVMLLALTELGRAAHRRRLSRPLPERAARLRAVYLVTIEGPAAGPGPAVQRAAAAELGKRVAHVVREDFIASGAADTKDSFTAELVDFSAW